MEDGLAEIRKITKIFHESQIRLNRIVEKYIKDKSLKDPYESTSQNYLLDEAITAHGKITLDAERKICLLEEMWQKQSAINAENEKSLQEQINTLLQEVWNIQNF